MTKNTDIIETREAILEREGLPVLMPETYEEAPSRIQDILDFSGTFENLLAYIERTKDVHIKIDYELGSIELYNDKMRLIGYIKPGHYTYNGVSSSHHLEKFIFDEYRGQGYGTLLWELYGKAGFQVPDEEYSHDIGSIKMLVRQGYTQIWKIENGNEIELSQWEIDKLLGEKSIPEDVTYKLKK